MHDRVRHDAETDMWLCIYLHILYVYLNTIIQFVYNIYLYQPQCYEVKAISVKSTTKSCDFI